MIDYTPGMIDYAARVAKGIALFDEKWPEWWVEGVGINVDILDISDGGRCATAQAAQRLGVGHYWLDGARYLGLTTSEEGTYIHHGFNVENGPDEYDGDRYVSPIDWENYRASEALDLLNYLWRNAVMERRNAANNT